MGVLKFWKRKQKKTEVEQAPKRAVPKGMAGVRVSHPTLNSAIQERKEAKKGFFSKKPTKESVVETRQQAARKWQSARAKEQYARRLEKTTDFLNKYKLLFLGIFVAIVLIALAAAGAFFVHQQQVFIIKKVEISGNNQIGDIDILQEVQDIYGRSLFQVSGADIERKLLAAQPYLRYVRVTKVIPSEINIDVTESFPVLAYITPVAIHLIDNQAKVVDALIIESAPDLSEEELKIIGDQGEPDSNYVLQYYIDTLSDAEKPKVEWDKISLDRKKQLLVEYKNKLVGDLEGRITSRLEQWRLSKYSTLPWASSYDLSNYKVNSYIPIDIMDLSTKVWGFMQENELAIDKAWWPYSFQFRIKILPNTEVIFSAAQDLDDQLTKFLVLWQRGQLDGAKIVDLQGEAVEVKR